MNCSRVSLGCGDLARASGVPDNLPLARDQAFPARDHC